MQKAQETGWTNDFRNKDEVSKQVSQNALRLAFNAVCCSEKIVRNWNIVKSYGLNVNKLLIYALIIYSRLRIFDWSSEDPLNKWKQCWAKVPL